MATCEIPDIGIGRTIGEAQAILLPGPRHTCHAGPTGLTAPLNPLEGMTPGPLLAEPRAPGPRSRSGTVERQEPAMRGGSVGGGCGRVYGPHHGGRSNRNGP